MNTFPVDRKRRHTFRDKILTPRGCTHIAASLAFGFYLFAKFFPQHRGFYWMTIPLPQPISDAGAFLPIHIWMFILWGLAEWRSRKYKNTQLFTATDHYSINENAVSWRGTHAYLPLGGITNHSGRPGPHDEGMAVIDQGYVRKLKKDFDASLIELVPVDLDELPPGVFRDFADMRYGEGELYYYGFTADELRPNAAGLIPALEMRSIWRQQNGLNTQRDAMTRTMVALGDASAAAATRARAVAEGRIPMQAVYAPPGQNSPAVVTYEDGR